MIIHITFPDGTVADFQLDPRDFASIDEMAEYIAQQICRKIPVIKNMARCIESHSRWILAQLYSKLLEEIGVF